MNRSFQRYLEAKRFLDNRSLNLHVWRELEERLPELDSILDVGCGTGSMWVRLRETGRLSPKAHYLGVDADPDNIVAAQKTVAGLSRPDDPARFTTGDFFHLQLAHAVDLVIAAALLDLVDCEKGLDRLLGFLRPGGLAYLPINFDGLTIFDPPDPRDPQILAAYHRSIDISGGDFQTGRKLLAAIRRRPVRLLAAGSSDWLVFPDAEGRYPDQDKYFLMHILHFFETSLAGHPDIPTADLEGWQAARRRQVEAGELIYIAHQFDFLLQKLQ